MDTERTCQDSRHYISASIQSDDRITQSRSGIWKLLSRLGKRAGVPTNPHKFRHTFATNYLRNGGDLLTLQTLLGHTSLEMVQLYARIVAADCAREHEKADPVDNWKL